MSYWVNVNTSPVPITSFTDTGLINGKTYYYNYYIVQALDASGNESTPSDEVSALPHYTIGWANLQWPPILNHTISVLNRIDNVYGQVWIEGATNQPGVTPSLHAHLGFGPAGSAPASSPGWRWVEAAFNVDAGNKDELVASLQLETVGSFDYAYRCSTANGREWICADLNGPIPSGEVPPNPGKLTVNPSGDATPPTVPAATDGTGEPVYIAGTVDRLEGGLLQWNPGGVVLTRLDATRWTVTVTGNENTQIEYNYALGSWDYVEKDASCGEIANRQMTLSCGPTGTQTVNDTVLDWRTVAPCGN